MYNTISLMAITNFFSDYLIWEGANLQRRSTSHLRKSDTVPGNFEN